MPYSPYRGITLSPTYINKSLYWHCVPFTLPSSSFRFHLLTWTSSFLEPTFPHLNLIIILGYIALHSLDLLVFISASCFPESGCYPELYHLKNFIISCHFFYSPFLALQFHAYSITLCLLFSPNFTRFLWLEYLFLFSF